MSEFKPKPLNSSLKCCKSNDSLVSVSSNHDKLVCDTKNDYVVVPSKDPDEALNNNVSITGKTMNFQYSVPKRISVDLEFKNVKYQTKVWSMKKYKFETKEILHGVSGTFKSGELSVIMGPSGAGKSTLLNVLAGFVTKGSTGDICLNGVQRTDSPRFRKLSAYIPQDEEVRLALTVMEAMTFAANLKLGYSVSRQYKMQQIKEILESIGLDQSHNTLTSRLSGGQRKRLAVALELISNPPILFLDEPTTGLDSASCSQCMYLFKKLAQEGRTIICTIHQPSALLFEMFDSLYVVATGKCIYEGPSNSLVTYLSKFNLNCPSYHNPADFLMEVAIGEYGTDLDLLAKAIEDKQAEHEFISNKEKESLFSKEKSWGLDDDMPSPSPAPVLMQFLLLYKRNLLINRRCWLYPVNRLLAHIIIGLLFGYLYQGVGANANQILANYVYLYGTMLLNVYTGKMSVTLSFPLEMKILVREHFNRWYKLSPYLMSVILIEIPFQIICTWTYLVISYYLTGQPLDNRAYLFVLFVTIGTLCAQSMGYLIGATTTTKIAVFIAPILACLFSVFGFCIRLFDTPYIFRWLFFISYFRAAFHGVVVSVYGFNRNDLYCPEEAVYCHYQDPVKFLKEMDIVNVDIVLNISLVLVIWCLMNTATYLTLWIKLNKR
ncbi:ATP-binding cassette sub-family G member 1-like [Sitophilus oryzae]|uniref:ATP-binding cassette sub-family G member 1-like n=1 Tax=Sitophilus oryzae TaxID=7048 RepID=A0A6J2YQQ9_SITOR|nr:ATP-binding cassette sub-family G member 1-like [Sitophilus oryzae]